MELKRGSSGSLFLVGAIITAFFVSAFLIRHTFSAVLTSLVLAYLVNPVLKKLESLGARRIFAISMIYVCMAAVATILTLVIVPAITGQIDDFREALPFYVQDIRDGLEQFKLYLTGRVNADEFAWLIGQVNETLTTLAADISGTGYQRLKGLFYAFFNILLSPILVFFMLAYKEKARDAVLLFTPDRFRDELLVLGRKVNDTLERFILAMCLDCFLVGVLCSLVLWLFDVDYYLLNGLLAGFASAVPFVGGLLAFIPPALIAYTKSGDPLMVAKIAGAYFLINIILEGNLIKPLVMRGTLQLNPLWVIFAVMAMGELLGFWGVILSIPLVAVVKICSGELKVYLRQEGIL
jgi:predicted PurR-regulated permease PerM